LTNQSIKDSIIIQGSGIVFLISDVEKASSYLARKDNIPREERIAILEEVKNCYELFFEQGNVLEYNIFSSELKKIKLKILPENVPHLLGVDQRYINTPYGNYFRKHVLGIENQKNIYPTEILRSIFKDIEKVVDFNEENGKNFFHYYRIRIKCEIFKQLLNLEEQTFARIMLNKNHLKSGTVEERISTKTTDFIAVLNADNKRLPFSFIGIRPDENVDLYKRLDEFYVPITLFLPFNPNAFFENQNICIPETINKRCDKGLSGRKIEDFEAEFLSKKIASLGNFEIVPVKKKI
jgi:hypothetical protein